MGIFKRIRDLTTASIHEMIDKAEDPVKMLNQYLREMEDDIAAAEISVARQIAIEKKFKHQWEEAEEMVDKRQEQALKALEANNESLARRALQDKKHHVGKAEEYKLQFSNAKVNADQLRSQLSGMKMQFEKLKNQKDILIARAQSAKAQRKLNEAMTTIGKDNGLKGFERMSDKVLQLEAEAEASKEFHQSNISLDDELDSLVNDELEHDLAVLRAQLEERKMQD